MNFKYGKPKTSRAGCLCDGKWDKKVTGNDKRKYQPELSEPRPRSSRFRKNRRRWCRGRVGVEHRPGWVAQHRYTAQPSGEQFESQIYECRHCGKHLGWRTIHITCGSSHSMRNACPRAA